MELQDFVAETLKQVITGVKAAQQHAIDNGAKINPSGLLVHNQKVKLWDQMSLTIPQEIESDVAVTTIEGKTTKGGIGVFVGPVGLGAQGQSDATNQSVSRLKFSVPIVLPVGDESS